MTDSQGLNTVFPVFKRFRAFMEELERITGKDRLDLCVSQEMTAFVESGFKFYRDVKGLSELYGQEYELDPNQPHSWYYPEPPKDVKFTTNCKELLTSWIPQQKAIVGCQMYLQDPEILRLLAKVEDGVCIVVNYSAWMDAQDKDTVGYRDYIFSLYSNLKWHSATDFDQEEDGILEKFYQEDISSDFKEQIGAAMRASRDPNPHKCPIQIFKPGPQSKGNILHLKYLIGLSKSSGISCLTGSYNISKNAYSNLESLLLIEGGDCVDRDMMYHHHIILNLEETISLDEFKRQYLPK